MEIVMEREGIFSNLSAEEAMKLCMDKHNESYKNHYVAACLVHAQDETASKTICKYLPGNYAEDNIKTFNKFCPGFKYTVIVYGPRIDLLANCNGNGRPSSVPVRWA